MLEVLHLDSGEGDFQSRQCSALLRRELGREFPAAIRTIGRGGDYRNLAHAAVALRAGWGPAVELVHAWDLRALVAAVFSSMPTVFSPSEPLTSRAARWLRLAAPRHSVHLVASTETQRQNWVRWGAAAERCHVIPPGVTPCGPIQRDDRLRERLGFSPGDYVVLAPGGSTRASEHWRALWAVSILHVLDVRYRLLLWGPGRNLGRALHLARRLGQERLLVIAERELDRDVEFEELLAVSDAALVAARGHVPTSPLLSCMAAGIPLVAARMPVTTELLRDHETALVMNGGAPRELAQAILRLREQPSLAQQLAANARADAIGRSGAAGYVEAMRRVYWAAGMTGGIPPASVLSASPSASSASQR